MGINISKNCFSPQSEPHTAKLCLSVVLKHFLGNSHRTSLISPKSDYLRNEHWNTQNLDLFKQLFLIKPLKGININKKYFSPQSEPHTAKLCLSVLLKHFLGNSHRTSLISQKSDYLRNEHWNTQKFCFSYHI